MGLLFNYGKREKDEYEEIYDDEIDYEELDENDDPDEVIANLKGTIGRGDCLYCNAKHAMVYDGFMCFICSECGMSIHEDLYYRWAAGYSID